MGFADWLKPVADAARPEAATATAAIAATDRDDAALLPAATVAAVAGIAVAEPPDASAGRWALHFADAEVLVLGCDPPLGLADVLTKYPTALAAEPLPGPLPDDLPPAIATMFAKCVAVGLYDEAEGAVLRAMHAADPDGTRVLVAEMHARIGRCYGCQHFSQPGLSDGYCGGREDLPHAYGPGHPLRGLPVDGGATCTAFKGRT